MKHSENKFLKYIGKEDLKKLLNDTILERDALLREAAKVKDCSAHFSANKALWGKVRFISQNIEKRPLASIMYDCMESYVKNVEEKHGVLQEYHGRMANRSTNDSYEISLLVRQTENLIASIDKELEKR